MNQSMATLTKSRFYSLALNAAVFDGPLRIYFSQPHESRALKIYFKMQNMIKESGFKFEGTYQEPQENIFVMLYPNSESFKEIFPDVLSEGFAISRLQQDWVVGINFDLAEDSIELIVEEFKKILGSWDNQEVEPAEKRSFTRQVFPKLEPSL